MTPPTDPTTQIYNALLEAYEHFNRALFGGSLPPVLIVLQRQAKTMGYASHKRWKSEGGAFTDELAVNPEYFLGYPLLEVLQTLVHEMVHIWQYHFGNPGRRSYHNKEWANKMISIGLMPSSTGQPGGRTTGEHMGDYAISDGLFYSAAVQLLKNGFELHWLDRFPQPTRSHRHAVYDQHGKVVGFEGREDQVKLLKPLGIDMAAATLPASPLSASTAEHAVEYLERKPTRNKYSCPCGTNIWGKPGLEIMCRMCNENFI